MKDRTIIALTAALMLAAMLTGQTLRGDFKAETISHPPIATSPDGWVVEQNRQMLLNINAVDAETLTRVDGIGEVLSERIIAYRESHGGFDSVDELIEVKGIGEKTLERIRGQLTCLP